MTVLRVSSYPARYSDKRGKTFGPNHELLDETQNQTPQKTLEEVFPTRIPWEGEIFESRLEELLASDHQEGKSHSSAAQPSSQGLRRCRIGKNWNLVTIC
jgi:hypothetical protein